MGIRCGSGNNEREGILLVVSGCLRLHRRTGEERSSVLSLFGPAQVLCDVEDSNGGYGVRFEYFAHESSILVYLPFHVLQGVLNQHPALWLELGRSLIEQKRKLAITVACQNLGSAMNRLAWILSSHLRQELGAGMAISLSQEDLGALARLCRQTTNFLLQRLEQSGAIRLAYGRVLVLDEARLCELASGMPLPYRSSPASGTLLQ